MKIFTARQIRDADGYTIHQEGIPSYELMERAALACFHWIRERYEPDTAMLVICGMGNNGGDGLALTRLLLQEGYPAKAVILKHAEQFSEDASYQFNRLHGLERESVRLLSPGDFITEIPDNIVLVDALLGSGLNRVPTGWLAEFIAACNELVNEKIAIDLPSGLPADSLPGTDGVVFKADHTLSLQLYKRSFFHAEAAYFTGQVSVLDIGLSSSFIRDTHTQVYVLDKAATLDIYRKRDPFSHKGRYGKAVLAGGSYGKIGAISLSTQAALRSGAGLVFTLAPRCGYTVLQSSAPEAMFIPGGENELVDWPIPQDTSAIGIGPGMGTHAASSASFAEFMASNTRPLVIDADALNLLAEDKTLLHHLPPGSILTPHPKEFERLFGPTQDSLLRTELARGKAMKHNVFIILKDHHTAILSPSGVCWYNNNGNAGMATGGSGDVLTGIITGLLAQGYSAQDAALLGVHLHGKSGDLAAEVCGEEALLASDLIRFLGQAFLSLKEVQ